MTTNIADLLNPELGATGSRYPSFDGNWRWTECIGCPAAPLHRALGCPARDLDAHTLALFYEGILHEKDLKSRIRQAGFTVIDYPEKEGVKADGLPIIFHPDGYLFELGEVLETKSIDAATSPVDFIEKHPQYVKQVRGYSKFLNMRGARIIAKSRLTGWILPDMVIDRDDAAIQPIIDNVRTITAMLDKGVQACNGPWAPGCSRDYLTRLFCPFHEIHCRADEATATAALEGLLSQYAAHRIIADELVTKVNDFRALIQDILKSATFDRVKNSEGISALVYNRSYTSVDYEKARAYLTGQQYNEVFVKGSSQTLRITIPKALRGLTQTTDSDEEEEQPIP